MVLHQPQKDIHVKKPSVLVVEDDTDIQQLVSYNLIKSGFNVTCADSGEAALLRTPEQPEDANKIAEVITRHGMAIHPGRHEVRVNGEAVHLTASEFTILEFLAGRPGWVSSRQEILEQIRGDDYSITPRAVDVQIFGLRKKLGPSGRYIETVRGFGYRIRE